jgi:zinc/manganese transport system substrate-binding protein
MSDGKRSSGAARRRRAVAFAAVVLVAGALAGCGTGSPLASGGKLQVVVAENFWGSIASQLAGARAVASSRLVIMNGAGYDGWVRKLVDANPDSGRVVLDVGDLVHVPVGGNPHQWYSPASVETFIRATTARLQRLDPANRAYYAGRRQRYESVGLRGYKELIASIRAQYAGTPIGGSESIVAPLAKGLGLTMETPASFLDAIAEGNDPTAADKATVDEQVAGHAIEVFVYNSQNSTPDVKRLLDAARKAAIPVTTVTETLTPAGATFQAWQSRQLRQLRDALARARAKAAS